MCVCFEILRFVVVVVFCFLLLSSTPAVLLNYHSIIILKDSKTSDDLANKLRHKSYTLSILIARAI